MFGARDPKTRPVAQTRQPTVMVMRQPKRFTKAPIKGPKMRNTAMVIELTHAVNKTKIYQSFIFYANYTLNVNQAPFFTFKGSKRPWVYKGKAARLQLERKLKSITTQKSHPFFLNAHQSRAGFISSHSWKLVKLVLYRDFNLASWWRSSSIISRMETGLKYVFVWSDSKFKLWLRKSISYYAENPKNALQQMQKNQYITLTIRPPRICWMVWK